MQMMRGRAKSVIPQALKLMNTGFQECLVVLFSNALQVVTSNQSNFSAVMFSTLLYYVNSWNAYVFNFSNLFCKAWAFVLPSIHFHKICCNFETLSDML